MKIPAWTPALLLAAGLVAIVATAAAAADKPGSGADDLRSAVSGLRGTDVPRSDDGSPEQRDGENEVASPSDERIRAWVDKLAAESGFADWHGARWERQPLGPGTHGWVVILSKDGREVGYLVFHAVDGGQWVLGEYGTGPYPLFSMNVLYRSLVQQGLIRTSFETFTAEWGRRLERIYRHPLQAHWRIPFDGETVYLDAKTAELLPFSNENPPQPETAGERLSIESKSDMRPDSGFSERISVEPFDPHTWSWVDGPPLSPDGPDDLKRRLIVGDRTILVTRPYGRGITYVFAVTGLDHWNDGTPWLALEQDGPRYVPWSAVRPMGEFSP